MFTLKFQHAIPDGGYIRIILPDEVLFHSTRDLADECLKMYDYDSYSEYIDC